MSQSGNRVWMFLCIVLALFLSLTVGLTFNPTADTTAQARGEATAGTSQTVDITLTEFSISPAEISVPPGVPVGVHRAQRRCGRARLHDRGGGGDRDDCGR